MSENTSRFPQLRVSMPRHNGEGYAKLTVRQFEQMNATLGKSRWFELFGTPERAARTLQPDTMSCKYCLLRNYCKDGVCFVDDYDALLEWLRGDAE